MSRTPRVVSLLPSATEMCYAVGIEPVAVSHECDYPPEARELPAVDRSRVANEGSSTAINEQVAAAEVGDGVYEIDLDALRAADPDLVLAQDVCDVCAIDGGLAGEALGAAGVDAEVLTLHSHSLAGVLDEIEAVGEAVGRAEAATEVVAGLGDRIAAVEDATADGGGEWNGDGGGNGGETRAGRPRVAVLDWMEPVMVAGHWVPELVEIAGGRYGLAEPGDRSTVREWTEIVEFDPEVLVAAPCGFELDRTVAHAGELTGREGWSELAAASAGRVVAVDGHHYVNRPGPRLVETLEYLAGVIRPDRFDAPPPDAVAELPETRPA